MRERRWETVGTLGFDQVLAVGERLASLGLSPAVPEKDIICYVEEWSVDKPEDFDRLDPWSTEDVTLVQAQDGWRGDFFLLAGGYHTVYQRHKDLGTYCSVSHPWLLPTRPETLERRAMFWVGFRHDYGFIRVRLHTVDVLAPGERRAGARRDCWVADRRRAFEAAVSLLGLPIEVETRQEALQLTVRDPHVPLLCSWPDAFGPCQFEYNTPDPYEFLVPASRLAATCEGEPATVRAYLTGFSEDALEEFQSLCPRARSAYRCSAHLPLDEVPELLQVIAPTGRLYATLCEFQTTQLLARGDEAWSVVGIMGQEGAFRIEVRFNRAPLPDKAVAGWLEQLLGLPVRYAPLPPFP